MAENMIKFLRGNVASLPQTATPGAVYFTKDEGLYLGLEDGSYHRYGDFITVANVASLPTTGAHETCMYYCESENVLAKWDGSEWVQINKQKTLEQLGGVAKSVYEAKMAALEKADTDNATATANLSTYVGTFTHDTAKTVVEYINAKTDGIATSGNLEALGARVTQAETDIDNIEKDYLKAADKTALEGKISTAQTAADNAQLYAEGVAKDLDDHEKDTTVHITAAERTAWNGKTTMAEVEAKGYLVAGDIAGKADKTQVATDIATAVETETNNRVAADNEIKASIGTVAEGKTVVQMIADAQTAATYNDSEVRGLISDNAEDIKAIADDYLKNADKEALQGNIDTVSGKVTTLIGEDANKSVRTIANEELAKQLIAEDASESLDTLAEIAAWIQSHPDDASAMNEAIVALQKQLQGIDAGEGTVKKYVDDAIAALNVGQYALAADLTALAGRVSALETASATHALKTEVEAVSDALEEYKTAHSGDYTNKQIDDAIDADVKVVSDALTEYKNAHASDYTNEQIDNAIANAGHASASDLATHTGNADIHVTTDDKAKWNAAEQNAKDYTDAQVEAAKTDASNKDAVVLSEAQNAVAAAKTELQTALDTYKTSNDAAVAGKADKATTLAGYGITDAMTTDDIIAMFTWGEFV